MNSETPIQKIRFGAYALGLIGTFLIVGFLVHLMQLNAVAPGISATRSAERMKTMSEFKAANMALTNGYAWQDEAKGFVRIPLDRAVELTLEQYTKDPVAARSNLMARATKAFAVPPPAPKPKNEFE